MPLFHCPSCGADTQASEEFAGKQVICPRCLKSGAVPTSADATPQGITTSALAHATPLRRAEDPNQPVSAVPKQEHEMLGWVTPKHLLAALNLCIIGSLVVALIMMAIRLARMADARSQSINNLKNIGLAIHGCHEVNKYLPYNGTVEPYAVDGNIRGGPAKSVHGAADFSTGSWAFQICPYLDQDPRSSKACSMAFSVPVYLCPGRDRPSCIKGGGLPWLDYFLNNYVNDPLNAAKPNNPDARKQLKDISDGLSHTILVGHGNIDTRQYKATENVTLSTSIFIGGTPGTMRSGDNGVAAPDGVTLRQDSAEAPTIGSWGGPFPQGGLMAMGDATVRLFPYGTQNFSSFLTPTGKEQVELPD